MENVRAAFEEEFRRATEGTAGRDDQAGALTIVCGVKDEELADAASTNRQVVWLVGEPWRGRLPHRQQPLPLNPLPILHHPVDAERVPNILQRVSIQHQ